MSKSTNKEGTKLTLAQRLSLTAKSVQVDAKTQSAIDATAKVLDANEQGLAVFPLCVEKNKATKGYLIVSIDSFHAGSDSVGIVIWKGTKTREMITESIESFGAELDAQTSKEDETEG